MVRKNVRGRLTGYHRGDPGGSPLIQKGDGKMQYDIMFGQTIPVRVECRLTGMQFDAYLIGRTSDWRMLIWYRGRDGGQLTRMQPRFVNVTKI